MRIFPVAITATWSAKSRTTSANCSTTTIVTPVARRGRARSSNSVSTISGREPHRQLVEQDQRRDRSRARGDSDSICCSPPESVPATCSRRSAQRAGTARRRSSSSSRAVRRLPEYVSIRMFSRTVRFGKMPRPSGMRHTPASRELLGRRSGDVVALEQQLSGRRPHERRSSPAASCVLPAPFGPRMATSEPPGTTRSIAVQHLDLLVRRADAAQLEERRRRRSLAVADWQRSHLARSDAPVRASAPSSPLGRGGPRRTPAAAATQRTQRGARSWPARPSGRRAVAMARSPMISGWSASDAVAPPSPPPSCGSARAARRRSSAPRNAPRHARDAEDRRDEQHGQRPEPEEVELADARLQAAEERAGRAGHQRGQAEHLELRRA